MEAEPAWPVGAEGSLHLALDVCLRDGGGGESVSVASVGDSSGLLGTGGDGGCWRRHRGSCCLASVSVP